MTYEELLCLLPIGHMVLERLFIVLRIVYY